MQALQLCGSATLLWEVKARRRTPQIQRMCRLLLTCTRNASRCELTCLCVTLWNSIAPFPQLVMIEFGGNSVFQKALKDAFEVFINKESASKFTNAELISTFCDRLLKGGM